MFRDMHFCSYSNQLFFCSYSNQLFFVISLKIFRATIFQAPLHKVYSSHVAKNRAWSTTSMCPVNPHGAKCFFLPTDFQGNQRPGQIINWSYLLGFPAFAIKEILPQGESFNQTVLTSSNVF